MNSTAVVFLVLGLALVAFGGVFAILGMSSERAYWFQRDPQGDPAHEATPFSRVLKSAFRLSVAETRAPLRIAAIGVVMWWFALLVLVTALVVAMAA